MTCGFVKSVKSGNVLVTSGSKGRTFKTGSKLLVCPNQCKTGKKKKEREQNKEHSKHCVSIGSILHRM